MMAPTEALVGRREKVQGHPVGYVPFFPWMDNPLGAFHGPSGKIYARDELLPRKGEDEYASRAREQQRQSVLKHELIHAWLKRQGPEGMWQSEEPTYGLQPTRAFGGYAKHRDDAYRTIDRLRESKDPFHRQLVKKLADLSGWEGYEKDSWRPVKGTRDLVDLLKYLRATEPPPKEWEVPLPEGLRK